MPGHPFQGERGHLLLVRIAGDFEADSGGEFRVGAVVGNDYGLPMPTVRIMAPDVSP